MPTLSARQQQVVYFLPVLMRLQVDYRSERMKTVFGLF
jgi:hypothetical protein